MYFGSTAATAVRVLSDTQLAVVAPAGTGAVAVTVQSGIALTDTISDNPNANVKAPIFGYGRSASTSADLFTILPAGPNAAKSAAHFGSATDASGTADALTITVTDAAGNAVGGVPASAFALHLAGTSTGSFGTVTETATAGTYTVPFTGTMAASTDTLSITVNGITLTSRPTIRVTPGAVSASRSTASFAASALVAGHSEVLTIAARDGAGNAISGLAASTFGLALASGGSGGKFGVVSAASIAGTYAVSFTGTTAGSASTLTATVAGVALAATPTVTVTPGALSGTVSTAAFATSPVVSGSTGTLTIAVKDAWGNAITGLASKAFALLLSGASTGTFSALTESATPGKYIATFTGSKAGTASLLSIAVNGATLAARPTIKVVPGAVSAATSTAHFAASSIKLGATDLLTIAVKDTAGNPISGLSSNTFAFTLASGTSTGTFGTVAETTTKGTYTVPFTATTAGSASTLTLTVASVTLNAAPTIQVVVG